MATNGNNSGNVNYSSPGHSNMGITGNLQNRMAGKEYSERFYREKSGYLDNSITEVKNLLKYYEEISSITKDLSKTEQNRFKKQQDALKEQLKTLEYVKDTREIDFEDSVKLIKEANKLLISGSKEYQRIMEETQDSQSKADKEHLGNLKEVSETINEIRDNAEKTNQDMKDTAKTLNNTASSTSEAWANSLNKVGDKIASISNMLNLSAIANNTAEQALRSRLAIQNDVMKQFGMTSNSQYNQFRQSAKDTLWQMNSRMGNMFNTQDMYNYFQNMSDLGITNQKMAEEQLQASIIGNKYLGVSIDTQTEIFKFMKRTNDYSSLQNHNKTVVALLRSQLGISKDQLSELAKIAYTSVTDLAASGMSAEAQQAYIDMSQVAGTAMLGQNISLDSVKSMQNLYSSFLNTDVEHLGDWAAILRGVDLKDLRDTGMQATDKVSAFNNYSRFIQAMQASGLTSTNNQDYLDTLKKLSPGLDAASLNGYRSLDLSRMTSDSNKIFNDMSKIDDRLVEDYIQETNELTVLESIENFTSFAKDWLESKNGVFNLANAALVAYLAAKPFEIINFFKDIKLTNLLTSSLGSGSALGKHMADTAGLSTGAGVGGKALSALGTGLAVVGLTAGTISALGSYFAGKQDQAYKNQYQENMNTLKGTDLAGNEAYASALTVSSASNSITGFGQDMGNTKYGLSYGISKLTTKDKKTLNKDLTTWMYRSGVLNNVDLVMAWAYLMNQVDSLDAMNEAIGSNFTSSGLYKYIQSKEFDNQKAWNNMAGLLDAGWWPYKDNNKGRIKTWEEAADMWDMTRYEGYHKAGKNYIPKDNYKALLHKGEMVLNEKEANAYREMEKNVGGQSDTLYSNQQKIVLGKIVPSKTDVGYAGAQMGLPSGWSLTSGYGTYTNMRDKYGKVAKHRGLDFAAPTGTQIRAANSGKIYSASYSGTGFGNSIKIATDSGVYNRYGHMTRFALGIRNGMKVRRGQLIGYVGSTGNSTGPHLHFQVDKSANDRDDINPWPYVMMEMFGGKGALGVSDVSVSGSNSATSATSTLPKVATARFINGASAITSTGGGESNVGGADRVVNSVDGGFNRLIAYLDNISKRQDEQQILLEAFSKSRASGKDL